MSTSKYSIFSLTINLGYPVIFTSWDLNHTVHVLFGSVLLGMVDFVAPGIIPVLEKAKIILTPFFF